MSSTQVTKHKTNLADLKKIKIKIKSIHLPSRRSTWIRILFSPSSLIFLRSVRTSPTPIQGINRRTLSRPPLRLTILLRRPLSPSPSIHSSSGRLSCRCHRRLIDTSKSTRHLPRPAYSPLFGLDSVLLCLSVVEHSTTTRRRSRLR